MCLLIGAVINVLVAWGIALAVNPLDGEHGGALRPTAGYQWDVSTTSNFGTLFLNSRRHDTRTGVTNTIPEDSIPSWSEFDIPLDEYRTAEGWIESRSTVARGWPMLSLRYYSDFLRSPDGELINRQNQWSIRWPCGQWKLYPLGDRTRQPLTHDIYIPLLPIWTGFAVNALVFAVPLWALLFGCAGMRRWRRLRRGLCERCGYQRGDSELCSECGGALSSLRSGRG